MKEHKHEDKNNNSCKEGKQRMKISTLNYSGVLTSPYQFFQSENQRENMLSDTFASIVNKKYPQFLEGKGEKFSWDMGSIDTKWNDRYAPINIIDAGIDKNTGFMMNEEEFQKEWERVHQATRDQLKKDYFDVKYKGEEIQKRMHIQIEKTRQFDLFTYQTLMKVYCNIDDISKIEKVDSKPYLQSRKQDFHKPYLNEDLKLNLTTHFIDIGKIDVLFFQQTNKTLLAGLKNKIKNYYVLTKSNVDSIILISKDYCKKDINFEEENKSFLINYAHALQINKCESIIPQNIANRLSFNNDSIFQAIGNLLLINVHTSSKKDKNAQQQKQISDQLAKIMKCLPQFAVVCGGDFNAALDLKMYQTTDKLDLAPNSKDIRTVYKKRTYMQPQRNKALKLDQDTKDHFLSNRAITASSVELISGAKLQNDKNLPLIPNKDHPYDHFMVVVEIQISPKKFK